jgi:hypothetical protein
MRTLSQLAKGRKRGRVHIPNLKAKQLQRTSTSTTKIRYSRRSYSKKIANRWIWNLNSNFKSILRLVVPTVD